MPQQGDTIQIILIQELAGVQLSNTTYWRVDDLGADPPTSVGLTDVMTGYFDSIKHVLTPSWSLVCGIYKNISRIEAKNIVFDTKTGEGLIDSHPSDQVVRFNRYASNLAPLPIKVAHGAFNQTGTIKSLSTRGRVNDMSLLTTLQNFLRTQQIFGANWTLGPQLRITETPPPNATYQYSNITQCQPAGRIFKLGVRKTSLCALA